MSNDVQGAGIIVAATFRSPSIGKRQSYDLNSTRGKLPPSLAASLLLILMSGPDGGRDSDLQPHKHPTSVPGFDGFEDVQRWLKEAVLSWKAK